MKLIKIIFIVCCFYNFSYATQDINGSKDTNSSSFEEEFGDTNKNAVFDPFEKYNRAMTTFNDKLYINVIDQVARGYSKVVPEGGRVAVGNFINNLYYPVRFSNNVLQFKFKNASKETGRFIINSTFGIGGFFDIAKTNLGWEESDEDLGQTLGFYGFPEGPHIVWPFLGPSNLRDTLGFVGDTYLNPLSNTKEHSINYKIPQNRLQEAGIYGYEKINKASLHLGEYESIKKDAIDLYPFLRDAYTQHRKEQIKE
jgi:phospholipid-binding lipoprotein MlaA